MSKTLAEKRLMVDTISEKMKNHKTCVFVTQNQIIGSESVEIRKILQKILSKVFCVKNSLLQRVLKDKKQDLEGLEGSVLMITSDNDLELLNTTNKLTKQIVGLKILCAVIDEKLLSKNMTKALCRYTNKNQIISTAVGTMMLPLFQFKNLLEQLKEQKEISN